MKESVIDNEAIQDKYETLIEAANNANLALTVWFDSKLNVYLPILARVYEEDNRLKLEPLALVVTPALERNLVPPILDDREVN